MDIFKSFMQTDSWITNKVNEVFFNFINGIVEGILSWTFQLMSNFLVQLNDLSAYFDYTKYLTSMQFIAGGLLTLTITNEVLKQTSGNICGGEQKSVGTLMGQTIFAGALIFIMPWSVNNFFMKINNALVQVIGGTSFDVEAFSVKSFMSLVSIDTFTKMGMLAPLLILVMAIGFLIIGVLAAVRYIELVIAILIAPISAVSFVRSKEAIRSWVVEVTALTFTQCIHVLLLHMLVNIMAKADSLVKPLLVIGVLVVMIKGPKVLKQYLYSTGAAGAGVGMAGMITQTAIAFK